MDRVARAAESPSWVSSPPELSWPSLPWAPALSLGQRATSPAVPAVGRAVIYPPDWQEYRAGERGDVVPAPRPSEWTTYRAGERATGSTPPAVGRAVIYPPDWQEYRAGERGDVVPAPRPSDWTTYRAGER